jgi:lipoprotein-releasing system ATP-binding protein
MSDALRLEGVEKGYNRGKPSEVQVLRGATLSVGGGRGRGAGGALGRGESRRFCISRGFWTRRMPGRWPLAGARWAACPTAPGPRRGAARWASSTSSTTCCPSSPRWKTWSSRNWPTGPRAGRPRRGRGNCWARSGWRIGSITARRRCRGANSSGSPFAARWPTGRGCSGRRADGEPGPGHVSDQVFGALMALVRATGMAALIATHNLDLAARMDRVVRLDAGRVA